MSEDLVEARVPVVRSDVAMRSKVNAIEAEMLRMPQVEMPVKHHFANAGTKLGVYGRELRIPKDTVLTGKIHKYEQLNVLAHGEMSVLTDSGVVRVKAPFVIVSPANTKRIAYAHEDCVWITCHGTDETDLEKIEAQFIAQSDAEFLDFVKLLENKKCLG